jgi:hypothetical protein
LLEQRDRLWSDAMPGGSFMFEMRHGNLIPRRQAFSDFA